MPEDGEVFQSKCTEASLFIFTSGHRSVDKPGNYSKATPRGCLTSRVLKNSAPCHSEGRRPFSARGICLSGKQLRLKSRFLASLEMTREPLLQQPARARLTGLLCMYSSFSSFFLSLHTLKS